MAYHPRVLKPLVAGLAALAGLIVGVSGARAEPRPYRGPHPVDYAGTWHLDRSVHVHDELPVGLGPFAEVDGVLVFLADPIEFGYEGTVWRYRGAHPLPAVVTGYCGIPGEHRHPFPPEGEFRSEDGVYVFVGALRGGVPTYRPGQTGVPESVARRREDRREEVPAVVGYGVYAPFAVGRPPRRRFHPHGRKRERRFSDPNPPCNTLTNPRATVGAGCPAVAPEAPPTPERTSPRVWRTRRGSIRLRGAAPPPRRRREGPGPDPF